MAWVWSVIKSEDPRINSVVLKSNYVKLMKKISTRLGTSKIRAVGKWHYDLWGAENTPLFTIKKKRFNRRRNIYQFRIKAKCNDIIVGERNLLNENEKLTICEDNIKIVVAGQNLVFDFIQFIPAPEKIKDLILSLKLKIISFLQSQSTTVLKCYSLKRDTMLALKIGTDLKKEINILNQLQPGHTNLIELIKTKHVISDTHYFASTLAFGGTLQDRIEKQPIKEESAKFIFKQVALALSWLHSKSIAHRNIRPWHILFMNQSERTIVKICSLGRACREREIPLVDLENDVTCYVAPEQLSNNIGKALKPLTKKVDVWSLGVCLYASVVGNLPYPAARSQACLLRKMEGESGGEVLGKFRAFSESGKVFVEKCLKFEESRRPSASQLYACDYF